MKLLDYRESESVPIFKESIIITSNKSWFYSDIDREVLLFLVDENNIQMKTYVGDEMVGLLSSLEITEDSPKCSSRFITETIMNINKWVILYGLSEGVSR